MAHALILQSKRNDPTGIYYNDLDLNSGSLYLREYEPREPDRRLLWSPGAINATGSQLVDYGWEPVRERIVVASSAYSTDEDLRNAVRQIQAKLESARVRQITGRGERVYLVFQPDGTTDDVWSEILDGELRVGRQYLDWPYERKRLLDVEIEIVRRPFWEDPGATRTLLAATTMNSAGSYHASTSTVVEGDVPAPLMLTFENTTATQYDKIFVGMKHRRWNATAAADSGTMYLWDFSGTAAGSAFGGQYLQLAATTNTSWSTAPAQNLFNLSDVSDRERQFGGYFKPLVRVWQNGGSAGDIEFRFEYRLGNSTSTGPWAHSVTAKTTQTGLWELLDLGVIRYPMDIITTDYNPAGVTGRLLWRSISGSSVQARLDYFQLLPMDNFVLVMPNPDLPQNAQIIVDANAHTFTPLQKDASGNYNGLAPAIGNEFYAQPSRDVTSGSFQSDAEISFYAFFDRASNENVLTDAAQLTVTYRPRWLSLFDALSGGTTYRWFS